MKRRSIFVAITGLALLSHTYAKDDQPTVFPTGSYLFIYPQTEGMEPAIYSAEIVRQKDGSKELVVFQDDNTSTATTIVEEENRFVAHSTRTITEDGRKRIITTIQSAQAGKQCIFGKAQTFRQGSLITERNFILLKK